jgi:hypothetical protein
MTSTGGSQHQRQRRCRTDLSFHSHAPPSSILHASSSVRTLFFGITLSFCSDHLALPPSRCPPPPTVHKLVTDSRTSTVITAPRANSNGIPCHALTHSQPGLAWPLLLVMLLLLLLLLLLQLLGAWSSCDKSIAASTPFNLSTSTCRCGLPKLISAVHTRYCAVVRCGTGVSAVPSWMYLASRAQSSPPLASLSGGVGMGEARV